MTKGPAERGVWTPVVVGVLASALLFAAAILIRRDIEAASSLVTNGLGDVFETAARQTFSNAAGGPLPDANALAQFLDQHRDEGLRYAAVIDDAGAIAASAGDALGSGTENGLVLFDKRARLVTRVGFRRGTTAPPPGGEAVAPRRSFRMALEFEPLPAVELERRSRQLLVIASACALAIIALALALSRALRQRERLGAELEHGRRLAALGTMSAVLAHEIRNPLASLKGHAQLLEESVETDPALAPQATRVVSEAVRLERLVTDLLAFVKSGELRPASVDAAVPLRDAIRSTSPERIDARFPEAAVMAQLDSGRLQQALENVLRNAVQATADHARVEASLAREAGMLVYRIRDHGGGIAPGEEDRIFEPFVTGRVQGVGLGLAITRRIVELHGGTISARNAEGGGAEFTLRIPERAG